MGTAPIATAATTIGAGTGRLRSRFTSSVRTKVSVPATNAVNSMTEEMTGRNAERLPVSISRRIPTPDNSARTVAIRHNIQATVAASAVRPSAASCWLNSSARTSARADVLRSLVFAPRLFANAFLPAQHNKKGAVLGTPPLGE